MTALAFEDVQEHNSTSVYYAAPNENVQQWRELVKGLRIERAAGICSSGEVGLFAMLPTVRKELVLVDHSYRSLSVAVMKYLMLRERGYQVALKLLTGEDPKRLRTCIDELKAFLPEALAEHLEKGTDYRGTSNPFFQMKRRREVYNAKARRYEYVTDPDDDRVNSEIIMYWNKLKADLRVVSKSTRKLDKVTFLHGDISDLKDRGPFDLLYLSNAFDHIRYSKNPRCPAGTVKYNEFSRVPSAVTGFLADVTAAVKPGGYIISTRTSYAEEAGWKEVKRFEYKKDSGWSTWTQVLYQVPAA